MLVAFEPQQGHRCPDGGRRIGVGDDVTVRMGLGEEEFTLAGMKVLVTPHDTLRCWQFVSGDRVYAVGAGAPFMITRKGE